MVLTGSSGLYEKSLGDSYPQRRNYDYIKKKAQEVFYNPRVATKELVDEVFEVVNNRMKVIRTLSLAKSAIRHNMAKDLPNLNQPACLIWGKNDLVTPPNVAEEFKKLLPDADLFWIDNCGHAPMMEYPTEFIDVLEGNYTMSTYYRGYQSRVDLITITADTTFNFKLNLTWGNNFDTWGKMANENYFS